MNWHNCSSTPSQSRFDQFGIDVVRVGIAIDQYGLCTNGTHGQCTRDKGISWGNDLVAFADPECLKGEPQRIKSTADGDAVCDTDKASERYFKFLNFSAEDKIALQ